MVVERREHVDRDMLSVALFGWIMDKLRAESSGKHQAGGPRAEHDDQTDGDDS